MRKYLVFYNYRHLNIGCHRHSFQINHFDNQLLVYYQCYQSIKQKITHIYINLGTKKKKNL